MKLKQAILTIMDRDTLKAVVDDLEIEGIDRRSVEDMRAGVSRSRRAAPEMLLAHLSEKQVKAVCEQMDVSPKGRRKELMERLLNTTGTEEQFPAKPSLPRSGKIAKGNRKPAQKESPPMADKQNMDNQNERQPAPVRLPDPPPGAMRVTRTELVWPGKYNEDGTLKEVPRVSLPFQVIETVNESRTDREAKKVPQQQTLFDIYDGKEGDSFEEGWKNKLIWGDNLLVMGSLLEKFAGKIDLIYIDPPFATGADFSFMAPIGESGDEVYKEQSIIEEKAYRDTWAKGPASYFEMIWNRLMLIRELLSDRGSIYVHIDWHFSHYIKSLMDEVFGSDGFRNEIVREKCNPKNYTSGQFGNIHDVIFLYSKSNKPIWNRIFSGRSPEQIDKDFPLIESSTGRRYKTAPLHAPGSRKGITGKPWKGIELPPNYHWRYIHDTLDELDAEGTIEWSSRGNPRKKVYADESEGYAIQDIWLALKDPGQQLYATEKPEALLDRIIQCSSMPGSLIADFFCGSGTTLAVAEKLGRRWIGCDLGRWAIHVTRKRLLGIEDCKPFEVLNLGKYERQYWQGVTFGEKKDKHLTEQAIYEYLAFILKLYGAQPVAGLVHLHGKKGRAMIHIGAVDAPVTIAEIDAAVEECVQVKQPELHVLGWEWEMGLYDLMVEAAKKKGVKLVLLQIPREVMEQQAAAKGDVRFFELAYLEAEIQKPVARPGLSVKQRDPTVQVVLKDFVIPNTELIPEEVRGKVKKWSDYIDYWAVDWDFQNDTFMQGWVAFRTRKERKLPLVSDPHAYDKPGRYRILVKVIDIFGNDTSQAFDVEVPLP